ncbi:PAS domain-containing protein [Kamptonema formosum]|uniref:PAS domain-containing protein n=1 Tax=Kamptonema formosum TaxID=331992 RepID=UPI00034A9E5E|nr:PAS domain-containing protein [Oscillatoria sp. PCC 10802]
MSQVTISEGLGGARQPGRLRRYSAAAIAPAITLLLVLLLHRAGAPIRPFLLFFAPVTLSAWYGGLGAGLLATALSGAAIDYFLLEPVDSLGAGWLHRLQISLFVLQGALLCATIASLQASERRLRLQARSLLASSEQLRLALEAGRTGIWDWNTGTGKVTWSENLERLFGLAPGSFQGTCEAFLECLHPDDRDRTWQKVNRALAEKGDCQDEYRTVWPDGSTHWIAAKGRFYCDETGTAVRMLGACTDITARVQSEEALRETALRMANILESITDGFVSTDTEWRLTYINPQAEKLLGKTPSELIGSFAREVFPELVSAGSCSLLQKAETERVTVECEEFFPRFGKWFALRIYPWEEGWSIYFQDVTSRKRAEQEIHSLNAFLEQRVAERTAQLEQARLAAQEASSRLQCIIEAIPNPIGALDLEYRFIAFNSAYQKDFAKVFGKPIELGMKLDDALADLPSERAKALEIWGRALRGEDFTVIEEFGDENLERKVYEIACSAHFDGSDRLIGASQIARDITSRVRAEEQSRRFSEELEKRVSERTAELESANRKLSQEIASRQQVQIALQESEKRLRLAMEAASLGMWCADIASGKIWWSERCREIMFGSVPDKSEYDFEDFSNCIHPEDRERVVRAARRARVTNEDYRCEFRVVWADNVIRWVADMGRVFCGDTGTPARLIGLVEDITGRVHREQSLKFLFEASAALASSLDWETTLASVVNLAVPQVADWCAIDILDAGGEIKRLAMAHAHPDKIQLAWELYLRYPPSSSRADLTACVLRTGKPKLFGEISEAVLAEMACDADHLQILREFSFKSAIAVPLAARGRTLGALVFVTAESGKRYGREDLRLAEELARRAAMAIDSALLYRSAQEAERRKEESLALLDTFLASAPVGMAFFDPDLRCARINDYMAAVNGVRAGETIGRTMREFLPELADAVEPLLRQVLETGQPVLNVEISGETKASAGEQHGLANYYPVRAKDGRLLGIGAAVTDITALKRTEKLLLEQARALLLQQQWLEAALNLMPVPLLFVEPGSARVTFANRAADEMAGGVFPAGKPAQDYHTGYYCTDAGGNPIPEEAMPGVRVARGERLDGVEINWHTPAGIRPLIVFADTLPGMHGHPASGVIVFQDISNLKQVQQALRRSEERFRLAQELSLDAFTVLRSIRDAGGAIVDFEWEYVNPTAAKILRHTVGELTGQRLLELLPGNKTSGLFDSYVRVVETGAGHDIEIPYNAEGIAGWFRNMAVKLGDGIAISFSDITERKRASEELYHREQEFRALAENSPDIIARVDKELRHLYVNPAIERATGMLPASFIGKSNAELGFPKEICLLWEEELRHIFATGQERWVEFQFDTPSGTRYYQSRLVPELALDGSVESVLGISRDVTEYKQIERALRQSEARLRRLVDSNIIGIVIGDLTGNLIEANDAFLEIIGATRSELQAGKICLRDLTPPEYRAAGERALEELLAAGACTPFEKEYLRKDGTRVPVLLGSALVEGERDICVSFVIDLTQRKELEKALRQQAEELARASRMKDEFLAVVSHELRTPLTAMLGWAKMLRSQILDEAKTARALETIERNAVRQSQLIEDLLDISRIITGKLGLELQPVDLAKVIEAAADTVRPAAENKGIELEFVKVGSVSPIKGDPARLQQVVWNLLSNAIKFTPAGGRVRVRLSLEMGDWASGNGHGAWGMGHGAPSIEENNQSPIPNPQSTIHNPQSTIHNPQSTIPQSPAPYAQIQVSDTGTGISPEFLPFVFERFRQADSSSTRAHGGLGLGLAIVRHITELHGGTIEVASAGEGKGATFTLRLPLAVSSSGHGQKGIGEEPPAPGDPCPIPDRPLTGVRVLVVDDDADTRELLEAILEEYGAEVRAAASVRQTLEVLLEWKPDAILSDIGMPEEDGYSLIRKLRALQQERGEPLVPVAALTAYAREEERQRALEAGFQAHISKPVEPALLADAIARLVGR